MRRPATAFVVVAMAAACGPASPQAKSASLAAQDVSCSEGVELVMACVPTGVELCFNAIDDNCNGVVDEGCGVATGPLQFSIAWSEPPRGKYRVEVKLNDPKSAPVPVCVRLGARVGGRTFGANVNLMHKDDKKTVTFAL